MEHEWHNPCTREHHYSGCMWCDGGLECCKVCGAFEGATPDECPGRRIPADFDDLIYKGIINFRNGNWYGECCNAMRHIHDTENWMREQGYVQDGLNKAGNPNWVRAE